jgi:isopentenyl-diphosphate delta-isomerase
MQVIEARANGNVPLIQSWGLREPALNLPYTGSLSLTLDGTASTASWQERPELDRDEIRVDGEPARGAAASRLQRFIDLLRGRARRSGACAVTITTSSGGVRGLGATAAAFAALALAGSAALDLPLAPRQLSMLARRGTGSAARAIFGGFVEGVAGELGDGSDCYAEELAAPEYWPIAALIAVVTHGAPAPTSAHAVKRSPFFPAWLDGHEDELEAARAAVRARDLERLGAIVEHHCLKARAVALAASPPILGWAPATLAVIERVPALRAAGHAAYFAIAAAPHVVVLCPPDQAAAIAAALADTPGVAQVIRSGPGAGAALVQRRMSTAAFSASAAAAALRERKESHLALCQTAQVEHGAKTTLFEDVELMHNAVPELALADVDCSTTFLGKQLRAPLLITGMTGGTEEARRINRDLATVAERAGIAFGLGSQRVMQRDARTAPTFAVRDVAPTVPLLANLGLTQAARQTTAEVAALVEGVGADALCLHLNPAQELVQPEGDRDFRGGLAALRRLCRELPVPVIAKETGCGISRAVGESLRDAGVRIVDVSGAGGTSWVRVETLRARGTDRALGEALAGWGIPTAASLVMLDGLELQLIASGGVRNGVEVAKAIALGAHLAGAALPLFRAYASGGIEGAAAWIATLQRELRAAMLLTGAAALRDLARQPVLLGPRLSAWTRAGRSHRVTSD